MATESVNAPSFTHWGRGADASLDLWVQGESDVVEEVALDVRDLLQRPDLLERLLAATRARLLWDAREVAKGNLLLDPAFPGYDSSPYAGPLGGLPC